MSRDKLVHILRTDNCIVDVNPRKNRIYARILKEAEEAPESSQLLEKLHEVKHYLSNGFTMLVEQSEKVAIPQEDVALIHDIMDLLLEGGICKIAKVCPNFLTPHKLLPKRDVKQMSKDIQHKEFMSRDAAEAWLDAA